MSFMNEKWIGAMLSGTYICSKCGAEMEFEDEWEAVLVCPKCGYDVEVDQYGFESDEEYEALYPTKEEVDGYCDENDEDEEDTGERYEEECGELDDYVPSNL